MEGQNRSITILLTKYNSQFGDFVCWASRSEYSHAAISLDEEPDTFYSFNRWGFVSEHPFRKKKGRRALKLEFNVPEEVYQKVAHQVELFRRHKEQYRYSKWGVLFCVLRIPHKFRHQYFCSQFVAELLDKGGIGTLQKSPSLYFPHQIVNKIQYRFAPHRVSCCMV
jgi:hypothetical protein